MAGRRGSRVGALAVAAAVGLVVGRAGRRPAGRAPERPTSPGSAPTEEPVRLPSTDEALPARPTVRWRLLAVAAPLAAFLLLSLLAWQLRPIDAPAASTARPGSVSLVVLNPVVGGEAVQTSSSLRVAATLDGTEEPADAVPACAGSVDVPDARPVSVQLQVDVRLPPEALPPGEYFLFPDFAVVLAGNARFRDPGAAAESMEQQLNRDLPAGTRVEVVVREKVLSLDAAREPVQVLTAVLPVYVPASVRRGIGMTLVVGGQICGSGVRRTDYWTVGRLPGTSDQLVAFTEGHSLLSAEEPSTEWETGEFTRWNKLPDPVSVSFDPGLVDYDVRVARPVQDQDDHAIYGTTWTGRASSDGPSFRIVDLDHETGAANRVFWAGIAAGLAGSVLLAVLQEALQSLRRRERRDAG